VICFNRLWLVTAGSMKKQEKRRQHCEVRQTGEK